MLDTLLLLLALIGCLLRDKDAFISFLRFAAPYAYALRDADATIATFSLRASHY